MQENKIIVDFSLKLANEILVRNINNLDEVSILIEVRLHDVIRDLMNDYSTQIVGAMKRSVEKADYLKRIEQQDKNRIGSKKYLSDYRQYTWGHIESENSQRFANALELKKKGISNVDIARQFDVSEGAVRKWLKKAESEEYIIKANYKVPEDGKIAAYVLEFTPRGYRVSAKKIEAILKSMEAEEVRTKKERKWKIEKIQLNAAKAKKAAANRAANGTAVNDDFEHLLTYVKERFGKEIIDDFNSRFAKENPNL